jgi:DNA-binding NtrC family response regulator
MEAELFGYEKGAFTGAIAQRIGKFERASRGTLLLDEISEMPVHLQAKLLRVLQEGEIDRLGSPHPIQIQTRVIATTNRLLPDLIRKNEFRSDLFYRLNVLRVNCPPLRGRKEAILNLTESFLRYFSMEEPFVLSESARDKILEHSWPGNIRELRNAVERAVLLAEGKKIGPEHIELEVFSNEIVPLSRLQTLAEIEQKHIFETLNHSEGNRTEAAKKLQISVRTLRNKLKEYRKSG